jgi:hypothetical protein
MAVAVLLVDELLVVVDGLGGETNLGEGLVVIGQLFCGDDHEAAGLVGEGGGMPTRRRRGGKP